MEVLRHAADGTESEAAFSACRRYRYRLTRRWGGGPAVAFVMLNPSTADERQGDPTIRRCEALARAAGAGGLIAVNLCAYRATRPAELFAAEDPEGPENAAVLAGLPAGLRILCAWGDHGLRAGRGPRAEAMLRAAGHDLWHLGLTRRGAPRHPLYLPATTQPAPLAAR